MRLRKLGWLLLSILLILSEAKDLFSPLAARVLGGQVVQINTHLCTLYGRPSWLLILRNMRTGKVLPYVYDIRQEDNYWIALPEGDAYRITASRLTWGPFAKVNNFCHLENGVIQGKSLWVTMTGVLSPDLCKFRCKIVKYLD